MTANPLEKFMVVVGLVLGFVGCRGSNLAACKTDGDCGDDGRSFCVDSICAQCRGENDCKSPKICGRDHTCKSLVMSRQENSALERQ